MLKTIGIVLGFLGAIMGHIYVCTYTEFPKYLCFIAPVLISGLAGFAASGGKLTGKPGNVIGKDDQDNRLISRFWGVSGLMLVALTIFTFIALSER